MMNMFILNAGAPMMIVWEFAEWLVRRPSRSAIINVSSTASYSPLPGLSVYSATKAFLRNLSLSMYNEMGDKVDVLTLCPGSIVT